MSEIKSFKENGERGFSEGWLPISDTRWKVETIVNDEFVDIGEVFVSGKLVAKEMHDHESIKGHEPRDVAEKLAHEKFPNANSIIVSQYRRRRNERKTN